MPTREEYALLGMFVKLVMQRTGRLTLRDDGEGWRAAAEPRATRYDRLMVNKLTQALASRLAGLLGGGGTP